MRSHEIFSCSWAILQALRNTWIWAPYPTTVTSFPERERGRGGGREGEKRRSRKKERGREHKLQQVNYCFLRQHFRQWFLNYSKVSSTYTSALDQNGSTQFELHVSRNVNANQTTLNRSKQDLHVQPPSNWIKLEQSCSWCKRNQTMRSNSSGTRDWLAHMCWSKWLQIRLMRRLSGFTSRCALTMPSV